MKCAGEIKLAGVIDYQSTLDLAEMNHNGTIILSAHHFLGRTIASRVFQTLALPLVLHRSSRVVEGRREINVRGAPGWSGISSQIDNEQARGADRCWCGGGDPWRCREQILRWADRHRLFKNLTVGLLEGIFLIILVDKINSRDEIFARSTQRQFPISQRSLIPGAGTKIGEQGIGGLTKRFCQIVQFENSYDPPERDGRISIVGKG